MSFLIFSSVKQSREPGLEGRDVTDSVTWCRGRSGSHRPGFSVLTHPLTLTESQCLSLPETRLVVVCGGVVLGDSGGRWEPRVTVQVFTEQSRHGGCRRWVHVCHVT